MRDNVADIAVSGLLWFPFVLAVGLTYRHLKFIDVSIDGISVVAGIGAALAWRSTDSIPLSLVVAALLGLGCSVLLGGMIHALRVEPVLAGVLLTLGLHSASVVAVGESLPLAGTRIAGDAKDFLGLIAGVAIALIVLVTLFYRSHFGALVRALGSNATFCSPLSPRWTLVAGLALSGLLVGLGAGVYVHAEGVARSGGGFDFLLSGFTSFLAVDRLLDPVRWSLSTRAPSSGRCDLRAAMVALLDSVPFLALLGSFFFQALVATALSVAPRPDLWKLGLALVLIASVAKPNWKTFRPHPTSHRANMAPGVGLAVSGARITLPDPAGSRVLLDQLSFQCGNGLAVLRGQNGTGKSTLLRALRGTASLDTGEIRVGGRQVQELPPHRRGIFLVRQEPHLNLAADLTVYENLLSVEKARSEPLKLASARRIRERLASWNGACLLPLDRLLTPDFLQRRAGYISGGEAQCVAILMAALAASPVILADEPTANLDADNLKRVRELLLSLALERVVLTASHDLSLESASTILLHIYQGTIVSNPPIPHCRGE